MGDHTFQTTTPSPLVGNLWWPVFPLFLHSLRILQIFVADLALCPPVDLLTCSPYQFHYVSFQRLGTSVPLLPSIYSGHSLQWLRSIPYQVTQRHCMLQRGKQKPKNKSPFNQIRPYSNTWNYDHPKFRFLNTSFKIESVRAREKFLH